MGVCETSVTMAKQIGPYYITGTIDDICFYRLDNQYYARLKSSLTGKRVKTDPRFARTREYASLLAKASSLASTIYRSLPAYTRNRELYQQLTGQAMQLLKSEGADAKVIDIIRKQLHE